LITRNHSRSNSQTDDGRSQLISTSSVHVTRVLLVTRTGEWHCRRPRYCTLPLPLPSYKHTTEQWPQQCTGLHIHPAPCHLAAMAFEALNDWTVCRGFLQAL